MKVFLGGTCNGSTWRDYVIDSINIDYFNPVVDDWTKEAQEREEYERENCDLCLYVITPKMTGVYSIAEVTADSILKPHNTILCVIENDDNNEFTEHQLKSLQQVKKLCAIHGARVFETLDDVINFLNYF